MRVQQVTGQVAFHGEGPVWSPAWGGLRWVDMLSGDVLTLGQDGAVHRQHVGDVAAVVRPRRSGGAVIAVERGFVLEDADGGRVALDELWSGESVRMNEGGCDPDGRFYCGSMAYDQAPGAATVYRLDPDLTVHVVLEGVTISNGLEWSPDGSLAYYNDTATGRIDVFDYDPVTGLSGRRPFHDLGGVGSPDGLTVDADGGVWTALHGGGAVHRYSPHGVLDDVVTVPTDNVTACAFGGDDLDRLYVTSSRQGREDDPLAGCLFVVEPGVRGLPVREFAG